MNKTAKSFTIVTGFSVVTRLISFLFKIWMSRALGAEIVGLYQIALSVILMLLTITSGAPTVLSRKIAEANATGDIKKQNSLTTASLVLGLGVSLTLCGVLYACSSKLGFLFADERCLPLFLIMLPTLITSTLYASFRSWFWGRKNFLAFSSTELLDEIVKIILAVVFATGIISTIESAQGIALALMLSDCVCVIVLALIFFFSGGKFAKPHGFKDLVTRTIPLSATRMITSLTASLTALVIPQILSQNGMTTAMATAEYGRVAGMALPLIMAPITLIASLAVVLIPDVASLKAQGQIDNVKKKLSSALIFSLLVASVFFVLYLPLGRHLGVLLFGDERAGEFVSYCSLMLYPIAIAQATTPMLNSLGKEKQTFFISLLGAILIVPCAFLLPKYIGTYAMAVGSGGCFLLIAICNLAVLKKEVGSFVDGKRSLQIVGFSIPLAVLGMLSERLIRPYTATVGTIVVIGVYLIFFIFLFVSAFEIVDIKGYVRLLKPNVFIKKRMRQSSIKTKKRANTKLLHKKQALPKAQVNRNNKVA